jgi:hypothetical protein
MKRLGAMRTIPALVVTFVLAACAPSPLASPSPAEATPGAPSPPAALVSTASPSGSAAAASDPTVPPSALVLGGTWLSPTPDARLTSFAANLSARPTATGDGVTAFTKVVFSATWAGAKTKIMCTTTKPGPGGAWSCAADLLARGVRPGAVSFSFDVYGEGVGAARSPDGARQVVYAVKPPKPTNASWKQIKAPDFSDSGDGTGTYRVRWSAPAGYADQFLVYNTWECPRYSKKNAGTPCFVAGTPVDVSRLEFLAKAPGDARSAKVRMPEAECGPSYGTILLRARNAYGNSGFAIVEVETVYWVDPNDTVC